MDRLRSDAIKNSGCRALRMIVDRVLKNWLARGSGGDVNVLVLNRSSRKGRGQHGVARQKYTGLQGLQSETIFLLLCTVHAPVF